MCQPAPIRSTSRHRARRAHQGHRGHRGHGAAVPLITALVVGLVGSVVATDPAVAVQVCSSGVPGDVNGDGFAEVVVGEPGHQQDSGAVHILYGTRSGLTARAAGTARADQYLTQDSVGVPGRKEAFALFGAQVRLADVDADGCADLVATAFGASGTEDYGSVIVLYGSPQGIRTDDAQELVLGGITPRGDASLVTADLDADGITDVAVASSAYQIDIDVDRVSVFYGDEDGLGRGRARDTLTAQSPGMPSGLGLRFGTGLAAGDFDADGRTDLAVGVSGVDADGAVLVLERRSDGFVAGQGLLDVQTPGVPTLRESYHDFGAVMAAGDVDADGADDLALGLAYRRCPPVCGGQQNNDPGVDGSVVLLPGSPTGLTGAGAQVWTRDSPGVAGRSQGESFGASLAMGRLDDGPTDDLAVGAPEDDLAGRRAVGSVTVLLGSASGLTTAGAGGTRLHQGTAGIAGSNESGDGFGSVLSTAYVQGSGSAVLIVGSPDERVGRERRAGQILQLRQSAAGPQARGSRTFTAASPGVPGRADVYDIFGAALS